MDDFTTLTYWNFWTCQSTTILADTVMFNNARSDDEGQAHPWDHIFLGFENYKEILPIFYQ